jgi:glycosyltransferase involved in cell wall biosynthesis
MLALHEAKGHIKDMKDKGTSNRKLTVAHFLPWSGVGGVEIATLRLADTTRERHRHVVFCLHDAADLRSLFEKAQIETVSYTPPVPSLRHGTTFYKASRGVADQIKQAGADIVHFADGESAYRNSLAALLSGCKIICHRRSSNPTLILRHRLSLLPVQSFIFVSKETRRSFAISVPDRKARVIYDAVDVSTEDMTESVAVVRREFNIPPDGTLVGMVARVAPEKDYFTLADAAVTVLEKYPDTRFLIAGDHSLVDLNRRHYAKVAARLQELGIADKFIFTGHRSDIAQLIAAMDIFVLCTHREGFPLSILEAMALRRPVVATAVGGIPEIVEPGVTGFLHQAGNSSELSAAILKLIEDPELASRIGAAGYERVRQDYSRQVFAGEIAKAYEDVMRR